MTPPEDQIPALDKALKSNGLGILEFIHALGQKENPSLRQAMRVLSAPFVVEKYNWLFCSCQYWQCPFRRPGYDVPFRGFNSSHHHAVASSEYVFYPNVLQLLPPSESQSFLYLRTSGYFDHSPRAKSIPTPKPAYASSSPFTSPFIYVIGSKEEHKKLFQESRGVTLDLAFILFAKPELAKEIYKKAVFGSGLVDEMIFMIWDRADKRLPRRLGKVE
ncbi:hypothetical protein DL96DRAFT_1708055 [Flagelloscypha sp. PMI_526]|nr:hypothetical protein DL96DRAFT_1708055 [Flagelloscypha sp. PMI_526]